MAKRKRCFDFLLSAVLIGLLSPLCLLLALIVKLSSPGPVLFRQLRVGRNGQQFHLLKFRTMFHIVRGASPGLTCQGDPRVTPAGTVLRKWKLDEIPQLFNIFCGEMSFVGPRPDLREFVSRLPLAQQEHVLLIRPGLTSPASLKFRDEEQVMGKRAGPNLTQFYVDVLLPAKVDLDMNYARQATFVKDCQLLWQTFASVLSRTAESALDCTP